MKSQCKSKEKIVYNLKIDNTNLNIKTELDDNNIDEDNIDIQVKIENEQSQDCQNIHNHHENLQLQLKLEVDAPVSLDALPNNHNPPYNGALNLLKSNETQLKYTSTITKPEEACDEIKVEQENTAEEGGLITCDNSEITDAGSMDSSDAAALSNVEACLQEEINIKNENKINYEDDQKQDQDFFEIEIKTETTAMEPGFISSNRLVNVTSMVTNPHHELIQSQTDTLVMEILPIESSNINLIHKISHPEEILPTSHNDIEYSNTDCESTFQLNSITGNVLSLEQEAYGLLKAKREIDIKDKKYFCVKCHKYFKTARSLKYHLNVHDAIDRRAQGVIKGLKTKKRNLKKRQTLELKLENERKNDIKLTDGGSKLEGYICTCGKRFRRRTRMETCLRSHDMFSETSIRHPCGTCTKMFKSKEDLSVHRKKFHSRKKFPCKFCPTDYNTRKELFKHLRIHQKVQLMEYKVISEFVKGKQKLRCFMCAKSYTDLSELKCHVMDDHKGPFVCRHCSETYPKIVDFGNHMRKMHPEIEGQTVLDVLEAFSKLVQAWKCEECEVQFHEPDKLALHQIEKHGPDSKSDSQVQCQDCRRVFISQKGLQSHRRVHHHCETLEETDVVEKGIMCLECRKMCKDMTSLTSHMRLHSPDRKYPCKFCDFRFATPEKRKIHAEIHTGDMKYVCFICDYQCSSENRLKYHKMTLKHLNMKEYLLTGKPLIEENLPSVTQEKNKGQKEEVKTLDNVENTNGDRNGESDTSSNCDSMEVTCDICGDNFPSESEMLDHKETHPFIEIANEDKPTRIFFK